MIPFALGLLLGCLLWPILYAAAFWCAETLCRLGTARFNHNYSMTQIYDYGYKAYVKPINNEIDEEKKPF